MSPRSMRLVDLYCCAANWNSSLKSVQEDIAEYDASLNIPGDHHATSKAWKQEAEAEVKEWSGRRDKVVVKMRVLVAQFDDRDKHHIVCGRRKTALDSDLIRADEFRAELRGLGVEPTW